MTQRVLPYTSTVTLVYTYIYCQICAVGGTKLVLKMWEKEVREILSHPASLSPSAADGHLDFFSKGGL